MHCFYHPSSMHYPSFAIFTLLSPLHHAHRQATCRRTMVKATHLVVPNHVMHGRTFSCSFPRLHCEQSHSRCVDPARQVQSLSLIPIPVTLCIHHPSHRSLSLKIARNIPHVTRSTNSPQFTVHRIRSILFFTLSSHFLLLVGRVWLVTCGFLHRFVFGP